MSNINVPTSIPELIALLIRTMPNLIGLVLLIAVLYNNYQTSESRRIDITDRYISLIQCEDNNRNQSP